MRRRAAARCAAPTPSASCTLDASRPDRGRAHERAADRGPGRRRGVPGQRRAGHPGAHQERASSCRRATSPRSPPTACASRAGRRRRRARRHAINWNIEAAEKGGYPHFTLKEIYEQPHAIQEALRGRVDAVGSGRRWPSWSRSTRRCGRSSGSTWSAAARPATRPLVGAHLIQEMGGPAGDRRRSAARCATRRRPSTSGRWSSASASPARRRTPWRPRRWRDERGATHRGGDQRGRQRADPRRRRGLLPAGRARGGGRLHQGLRDPGGGAGADRAAPGAAARAR